MAVTLEENNNILFAHKNASFNLVDQQNYTIHLEKIHRFKLLLDVLYK